MFEQFIEGFNKIRKPLLTGYCVLFVWWLYKAPVSLDKTEAERAAEEDQSAQLLDSPLDLDLPLGLSADQAERLSDLWAAMPASAQTAAIAFLALSIGGLLNTIIYAFVTQFFWDPYEAASSEAQFGYHAAGCLTFTGILILLFSLCAEPQQRFGLWPIAAAIIIFGTTFARSALNNKQAKMRAVPTTERIEHDIVEFAKSEPVSKSTGMFVRKLQDEEPAFMLNAAALRAAISSHLVLDAAREGTDPLPNAVWEDTLEGAEKIRALVRDYLVVELRAGVKAVGMGIPGADNTDDPATTPGSNEKGQVDHD